MKWRLLGIPLIFFAFVLLTNRWMGFYQGIDFLQASDTKAYMTLAKAAPRLPARAEPRLELQHSQRIFLHYIVGAVSKITGITLETTYRITAICFELAIIFLLFLLLSSFSLSPQIIALCFSLLVFNPYLFRYFLIVPAMSSDLLFITGLACVLLGLEKVCIATLVAGLILGALGRQTALLILPGVVFWVLNAEKWKESYRPKLRWIVSVASVIIVVAVYKGTSALVGPFSQVRVPPSTFLFFKWVEFDQKHLREFVDHVARVFFPHFLIFAIFTPNLFDKKQRKQFLRSEPFACLLMATGILSLPLLMNPPMALLNQPRHSMPATLPLVVAMAYFFDGKKFKFSNKQWALIGAGVLLFSFHHAYSVIGPQTAAQFFILGVVATILVMRAKTEVKA